MENKTLLKDLIELVCDNYQSVTINEITGSGDVTRKWVVEPHNPMLKNIPDGILHGTVHSIVIYLDTINVTVERKDKNAVSTKEQERKALEQIKEIIKALGPDSYVGAAFEGCFDIAESNIENDFLCRVENYLAELKECRKELEQKEEELMAKREETDKLHDHIRYLKKQLDKELEWKDYTSPYHVSKEEYLELENAGCSLIYEERAKTIVSERFGFQIDMIHIIQEMSVEQINRHKQVRVVGAFDCRPIYFATDMNYIRFECMGTVYEVYNGDLRISR